MVSDAQIVDDDVGSAFRVELDIHLMAPKRMADFLNRLLDLRGQRRSPLGIVVRRYRPEFLVGVQLDGFAISDLL